MKAKFFATTLTAVTLLTMSTLGQAAPTNPLSPSYGRDAITIAEHLNTNAMVYVDKTNPLDPRYSHDGNAGNWVATAKSSEQGYRDVANPLHPSFKRI